MCLISINFEGVTLKGALGGCIQDCFCYSFFEYFVFTMPENPGGIVENGATVLELRKFMFRRN
eukprot:4047813-Ditylum_brightwellii.AAC.1